ncbi:hypothetical protein CCS92_33595, partial [Methylobacterium radiotolerans]
MSRPAREGDRSGHVRDRDHRGWLRLSGRVRHRGAARADRARARGDAEVRRRAAPADRRAGEIGRPAWRGRVVRSLEGTTGARRTQTHNKTNTPK